MEVFAEKENIKRRLVAPVFAAVTKTRKPAATALEQNRRVARGVTDIVIKPYTASPTTVIYRFSLHKKCTHNIKHTLYIYIYVI